ncbi:MAG: hypothetical protein AAFO07_33240, partial [Bacteroidota bacterium]
MIQLFAKKYEKTIFLESILYAYKMRLIEKTGTLPSEPEAKYFFHGVGCRVEFINCIIDFDFGPCGLYGGFDLYRLNEYLNSLSESKEYLDLKAKPKELKKTFEKLILDGKIFKPGFESTEHIF